MNVFYTYLNTCYNCVRSLVIISLILAAFIGSFLLVRHCLIMSRTHALKPMILVRNIVLCVVAIAFTVSFTVCAADYTYPFERSVKFEKIATIDIPPDNALNPEFPPFWHAAYAQYGLYPSSFYFSVENSHSVIDKGFQWPEMDFENHTYIITYCHELESLSYNVWETIKITGVHTGAKAGYAVLSEEIDPCKVYIYEIPKIRIDNDRNLSTEFVRQKMREAGELPFD